VFGRKKMITTSIGLISKDTLLHNFNMVETSFNKRINDLNSTVDRNLNLFVISVRSSIKEYLVKTYGKHKVHYTHEDYSLYGKPTYINLTSKGEKLVNDLFKKLIPIITFDKVKNSLGTIKEVFDLRNELEDLRTQYSNNELEDDDMIE
jgi:hypothetical protein